MAIKLGINPKEFKKSTTIVLLDGTQDTILVTFKYRTRQQFAQLLDEHRAEDKMANEAEEKALKDESFTVEKMYLDSTKKTAERVMQIASGWDLVEPFDVDHLMQLENEFPGALQGIRNLYQASVAEARVKN